MITAASPMIPRPPGARTVRGRTRPRNGRTSSARRRTEAVYFVTRYDLDGAFTAITGRQHPGCADAVNFATATKGTWNGVWTQKVSGEFDYNPDATINPMSSETTSLGLRRWTSSATSSTITTRAETTGATHSTLRIIRRTKAERSEIARQLEEGPGRGRPLVA